MGESESVKVHCVLYISICGNIQSLSENVTWFFIPLLWHNQSIVRIEVLCNYHICSNTEKYLIFVASKFGEFKRLTYWHSLSLADSY